MLALLVIGVLSACGGEHPRDVCVSDGDCADDEVCYFDERCVPQEIAVRVGARLGQECTVRDGQELGCEAGIPCRMRYCFEPVEDGGADASNSDTPDLEPSDMTDGDLEDAGDAEDAGDSEDAGDLEDAGDAELPDQGDEDDTER